ncbi:MAG TPA: CBS domain-containing protein [Candidatus Dormibacteraeota bacterium]|nr:CBS domain-containing protein [Candidatus Dormibacteraeota bacterium]
MRIATLVNPGVVWAEADEPLVALARRMREHGIGSLPVREGRRLAGIVTERDVVGAVADGVATTATARTCMTRDPALATPAEECADVALRMMELGVRHLLVVEHGQVVGVVSARDLLMLEAWPGHQPPVAPLATQ